MAFLYIYTALCDLFHTAATEVAAATEISKLWKLFWIKCKGLCIRRTAVSLA